MVITLWLSFGDDAEGDMGQGCVNVGSTSIFLKLIDQVGQWAMGFNLALGGAS